MLTSIDISPAAGCHPAISTNRELLLQHLEDHENRKFSGGGILSRATEINRLKKENTKLRKRLNAVQIIANEENIT